MRKAIFTCLFVSCLLSLTGSASANRLTEAGYDRCAGEATLPPTECALYQEASWNGGAGCITWEEYLYAKDYFIAPMCNQFRPTVYLGFCRCGCLAKTTQVYVERDNALQWAAIDSLPGKEAESKMLALAEQATMSTWDFSTPGIAAMTIGPEQKPLVWIRTTSGLSIGLTETHGVLRADGFMARAVELKLGDTLVNMDGSPETVVSIDRKETGENVYNVLTNAGVKNKAGHIVFANELAVGDLYWQNVLEEEFVKLAVRK